MSGLAAAILASVIWGVSPIYYKALGHVPPLELLAHRISWGCVVVLLYCVATGRLGRLRATLGSRQVATLALTASLISINWYGFLWALQADRAIEAGMGYYVMPLVAVGLGVVVLGERLSVTQWAAVTLAAAAVGALAVGLGMFPWLALGLAVTFALYNLVKKRMDTGPIVGFAVESMIAAPVAVVWIWGVESAGWVGPTGGQGAWFGREATTTVMLVLSGPLTSVPLILFAEAARRMPFSRVGLVQYINPTMQVVVAATLFGEPFTRWHAAASALIWGGLALYTQEAVRQERASRAVRASSTVSATLR